MSDTRYGYTFACRIEALPDWHPEEEIVHRVAPHCTLPQLLECFERFLLASGFSLDGTLDIVPRDAPRVVDPSEDG